MHTIPRINTNFMTCVTGEYTSLQRYDTLWKSNSGAQGALPDKVFDVLRKYLHVEGECFASPLNRRLKKFYSAFPDTDQCFGSLGSFFSQNNSRMVGSWECNPPFDVKSVKNTIDKISILLETAVSLDEALSFAVFFAQFSSQSEVRKVSENYRNFSVRKRQWWITYICMVFNTDLIVVV